MPPWDLRQSWNASTTAFPRLHDVPLTRSEVMYVGPKDRSWPWMLHEPALADPVGISASAAARTGTHALDRRCMRPIVGIQVVALLAVDAQRGRSASSVRCATIFSWRATMS